MLLSTVSKCAKPNKIKSIRDAGFSLVEVLIGTAILAGLGASILYTTSVKSINVSQSSNRLRCEASTASALSFLESQGLVSQIVFWLPPSTTVAARSVPSYLQFANPPYIAPEDLWSPGLPEFIGNGPSPVLANATMLGGAVRNLSSIYNRGGYCTAPAVYGPLNDYLNSINTNLSSTNNLNTNSVTTIQVVPYNIDDGSTHCELTPPLYIYPRSKSPANDAYVAGLVSHSANASSQYGFIATIQTTFTDTTVTPALSYMCSAQHKFQYQTDTIPPIQMSAVSMLPPYNTTSYAAVAACASGPMTFGMTAQIGYSAVPPLPESGTVLLCQDQSKQVNYANTYGCLPGGGPTQTHGPAPTITGETPYNPNPPWLPCDQAQICGVNPISSSKDATGLSYSLSYNLPYDCDVALQAISVDAAGNMSPSASLSITSNGTTAQSIIENPSCSGIYCGVVPSTWTAAAIAAEPNGYYYCGGPCP